MATDEYIPVAADDWYQRRRQDAEGEFFRHVADQGPRKGAGGSTRQGIYCLTASGKLLAYKNAQDPDVMREVLEQGLAAWQSLNPAERKPRKSEAAPSDKAQDARYTRTLPEGGLIANVFTRAVERDDQGELTACEKDAGIPGSKAAARDHLWLTATDQQSLVEAAQAASRGNAFPLPEPITRRIARFHLIDNTRGEPPLWSPEEVRAANLTLTVKEATADAIHLVLSGDVLLATDAEIEKADRGYDVRLLGHVTIDLARQAVTRFDLVAIGEHWGEGPYTGGARPGRTPLAVAFDLSDGTKPGDNVPPAGIRDRWDYLGE